jgi:hypothetical protein
VVLKDSQDTNIAGDITSDMGANTVYFTPAEFLVKDETYTCTVSADVSDLYDNLLDGNKNGIAEGVGIDEFIFNFTTVPNYPPMINPITNQKPIEDIELVLNINSKISDADTAKEQLILTENSTYATLNGFDLTMLYPEGVLHDVINLTVSDGLYTVYRHIQVEVTPVNDPPKLASIGKLQLYEDISYELNMTDYLTDVDTPYHEFTMIDNSKHTEINGMDINFTYKEGVTEDLVNITIFDLDFTLYVDLEVEIEPVNDPPVFNELPIVVVKEDIQYVLDVATYISDIDTAKDSLKITVVSDYITVNNHVLTMLYPDTVTREVLEIKVYDGEYYDNTTLEVMVDPVNDPPVILKVISPTDGDEFEHNDTIDLTAEVFDADLKFGDTLKFQWYSLKSGVIAKTQNATEISLDPGEHMISFTVTDQEGDRAQVNLNITVKKKPEVKPPEPEPDDNKTTGDDTPDPKESSDDNTMMILGIILVIVIIVVLIGLMVVRNKKKVKAEASPEATPETTQMVQPPPMPMPMMPPQPPMPMGYPGDPSMMPGQMGQIDPSLLPYGDQAMMGMQMPMPMQTQGMDQYQNGDQMQYADASQQYGQYGDQTMQQQQPGLPVPEQPQSPADLPTGTVSETPMIDSVVDTPQLPEYTATTPTPETEVQPELDPAVADQTNEEFSDPTINLPEDDEASPFKLPETEMDDTGTGETTATEGSTDTAKTSQAKPEQDTNES